MRGLAPQLSARKSPIRVNCVAPSWTQTGIIPPGFLEAISITAQSPTVVAYSVGLLAVDQSRTCQTIYSHNGEFCEIDRPVMQYCRDAMVMDDGGAAGMNHAKPGAGDFKSDWERMAGLFDLDEMRGISSNPAK